MGGTSCFQLSNQLNKVYQISTEIPTLYHWYLQDLSKNVTLFKMEKRVSYYVSPKNGLTWLAAILMVGSVGLRIADLCGKGADARTMWMQFILPVAACLIFGL